MKKGKRCLKTQPNYAVSFNQKPSKMKSYQLVFLSLLFTGLASQTYGQRRESRERSDLIEATALQLTEEAFEAAKSAPLNEAYKISDRGLLTPNDDYRLIMNMGDGNVTCALISGRGEMEALIPMPDSKDIEGGGIAWCVCDERDGCSIQRIVMNGELRLYCRGACGCKITIQKELKLFSKYRDMSGRWQNFRR